MKTFFDLDDKDLNPATLSDEIRILIDKIDELEFKHSLEGTGAAGVMRTLAHNLAFKPYMLSRGLTSQDELRGYFNKHCNALEAYMKKLDECPNFRREESKKTGNIAFPYKIVDVELRNYVDYVNYVVSQDC